MDVNSESILGESSRIGYTRDSSAVNSSSLHVLSSTCALCRRILSSDNETGNVDTISVCGDCKFLLLEDLETASPDVYPRRMHILTRRYDSSESIESMFSQQFSQIITLARQNHSMVSEHDNQSVDGDGDGDGDGVGAARLLQHASSRTTPSGSRRWRRVFSDTESDGFDSLYGESDSNVSFRRYRVSHGEADTISYSAYGGDSDASIDGHSFLGNENLNEGSDLESDTDNDPMNAGRYRWNSEEEDEGEDDSEWEEADRETLESLRRAQLHGPSRSDGSNAYINWRRQLLSPEVEGTFPLMTQSHTGEELETPNYVGGYLHARGFQVLLNHLAETESSTRGAPPASVSFISNMRCMTYKDEKMDSVACAICKESFIVGTAVNELPCFHLYHPSCILPWLSARNTCPLCRYELPTDDKDYEARKRNRGNEYETLRIHRHDINDSYLDAVYAESVVDEPHDDREQMELVNADSASENGNGSGAVQRNRWFFLAAAPVVSILGISLVLWFGNSSAASYRRCRNSRRENGQRRWWSFF